MTDARLVECFRDHRDEVAFEALVRRHGPMVMGVCARILHDRHDAEDAFQATFLVLVRKVASVSPPGMVGNWLYGVAYQTAIKARAMADRRGAKERQVMGTPEPAAPDGDDALWREVRPIIDEELGRLPAKYRAPLVLCDIEERSYKEAAEQLGWPEGTVAGRLSRARAMLAARLTRRGVVLPAVALPALLAQNAAAAVPAAVIAPTVKAAVLVATGQATTGAISANVVALTEGVVRAMLLTKLKAATAILFAACLVVAGVGFALSPAPADGEDQKKPAQPPVQPQPKDQKVEPKKVDPKAAPKQGNGNGPNGGNQNNQKNDGQKNQNDDGQNNQNDDGQQNQKNDGQQNQKDDGQQNQGVVKAVDQNANTLTVLVGQQGKAVEKVFTLPKDVPVVVGGKPAKLGDVKPGMKVNVALDKDKKGVAGIKQVNEPNGQNNNGNKGNGNNGNGQNNQKNG